MIGRHIIDRLTVAQEDALLTSKLTLGAVNDEHGRHCLGGALSLAGGLEFWGQPAHRGRKFYNWYNRLCQRLAGIPASRQEDGGQLFDKCRVSAPPKLLAGAARAGEMIRARILRNRLRRELAPASRNTPVSAVSLGERPA